MHTNMFNVLLSSKIAPFKDGQIVVWDDLKEMQQDKDIHFGQLTTLHMKDLRNHKIVRYVQNLKLTTIVYTACQLKNPISVLVLATISLYIYRMVVWFSDMVIIVKDALAILKLLIGQFQNLSVNSS